MNATKPKIQHQGKVIVERHGTYFWMMFPDGSIEEWKSKRTVVRRAKAWFYVHNDPARIGVGEIEWRL
jgi:hypothetical protein